MTDLLSFPSGLVPRIVFEDTHLIVVSKPAGLLSQGEISGEASLVDWCRGYFGRNYVGLVHRLDRNTSGLMVVAKRSKAAERLSSALQSGDLVRNYRALLVGNLRSAAHWTHWLKKNESTNTSSVVRPGTSGAKEALLKVNPLAWYSERGAGEGSVAMTLAEFQLDTGRSHQIRVQSAAMGFPLVGDTKYGGVSAREGGGSRLGGVGSSARLGEFPRPALHSSELRFPHPMTKEMMEFHEASAPDVQRFLAGFVLVSD